MTNTIKGIIENSGVLVCPSCNGFGEIDYFCGHESSRQCTMCAGHGVIHSTKKQRHSKKCSICNGKEGGCGGCNDHPHGLIEWESYELFKDKQ